MAGDTWYNKARIQVVGEKRMMSENKGHFIWVPRALAIVFVLFISLFALDVFSGQASFLQRLGGLFFHLIPSLVVLGLLLIYWNHPLYSGIVFIIISALFTFFFQTYRAWSSFLLLSIPLLLIGLLFIIAHTRIGKGSLGEEEDQKTI
ncbi:MAG TPA: hypothetical protein VN426_02125 [Syntrophomonadaceae bacterium]|nr:hypothetical protein [Syntrophomonadaceae bacterium]